MKKYAPRNAAPAGLPVKPAAALSPLTPKAAALFVNEYGDTSMTADQIIEHDDTPIPSGLLDQWGRPLYRVREHIRFGFVGANTTSMN